MSPQIIPTPDKRQLQIYLKCTKLELAQMLQGANKTIDKLREINPTTLGTCGPWQRLTVRVTPKPRRTKKGKKP